MLKTSLARSAVIGLGVIFAFAAVTSFHESSHAQTADHDEQEDDGQAITLEQVPEPARLAIKKAADGSTLTEVVAENEDGVTVYEAAWKVGDAEHEVVVAADGTVCETEQVIPMSNAPKSVQRMAGKYFPAGATVIVEKKALVVYSLEAMIDGKEKELLLSAAGQPIEIEADGELDDGDKDEEGQDED